MIKYLKNILTSLFILLSLSTLKAQEIDGVAAVLEEHIILKSMIEAQYLQAESQGTILPPDAKCLILDQLLLEKLFLAQAEKDSIYISEEEVNTELDRRMSIFIQMLGTKEKLEEYYGKTIFELKEDFREDVSQQMLAERMKATIFKDLNISPSEVLDYYNEIPKDSLPYFNAEVEIGQIVLFEKPNLKQNIVAKEKAESIRKDIIGGSDFSFQALLYSDDPGSSSNGGDLGWVKRGSFVPDFEAVAFRLKEGEMSEVVETEFGYHIIQLIKKEGNRIKAKHILITPDMNANNLTEVKTEIEKIKIKLESGELTFQKAVKLYSEDEETKYSGGLIQNRETGNNFFEMNKLEGAIAVALDNKTPGDFSDVLVYENLRGKKGYRIIYLKSETPAHKASIETDYSKIKAVAKQAKQFDILNEWIEEKSKAVFVKIKDKYKTCESLNKWL